MFITISIVTLAFGWLLFETDFLRVRLPYGKAKSLNYIDALSKMMDEHWIEIESYLVIKPMFPQLATKINDILMLPKPSQSSYFTLCDLEENSDLIIKTVVNVGAKIL